MLRRTETKFGKVVGLPGTNTRITVYKGIPYAKPPVGERRWRAPEPLTEGWEGELKAYTYKNISVQDNPGVGDGLYDREWHVDSELPMGEDCLYLNIWTPAKTTEDKLPVLVWYFGGGFQWGYTCEMEFDGESLAKRGIVVVSVNYRLGALGFLAHPEITKESPKAPANFGLLDQQAGLHWVHENIKAFGGDPDNISLGGQSAGGASVLSQITNDKNFGIVKSAIIMSGMIRNPYYQDPFMIPIELSEYEKLGVEFFEFLGVKTLEEARKLDAFHIRDMYAKFRERGRMFVPCIDHEFMVDETYRRLVTGKYANIPIMSGNTKDEFPTPAEYLPKEDHEPVNGIECSVKAAARSLYDNGFGDRFYYYRFNPDIPGEDNPGTFHSCDLWFFFDNLIKCHRPYVGRHFDIARQMCDYWTNFIKTGNPNGIGSDKEKLPEWKPCGQSRFEMEFTKNGAVSIENNDAFIEKLMDKVISDTCS